MASLYQVVGRSTSYRTATTTAVSDSTAVYIVLDLDLDLEYGTIDIYLATVVSVPLRAKGAFYAYACSQDTTALQSCLQFGFY